MWLFSALHESMKSIKPCRTNSYYFFRYHIACCSPYTLSTLKHAHESGADMRVKKLPTIFLMNFKILVLHSISQCILGVNGNVGIC